MEKLKIAMMSMTHGHTRKYYDVLQHNPKLSFVAVSTENETARENFLRAVSGVPCYNSDEEMLNAHPEIEAVVIASANSRHYEQMKLCAERGIDILSMKIPTFDMEEYEKIEELVKKSGVVCQVELECHYNPVTVRFKELVKSGKMGKIYSFNARNTTLSPVWAFPWQGVPEESYGKRVSLCAGNPRFRGGALCDHPHIFDMIREVTGSEFEFVFARQAPNLRADIEVEDMLSVVGRMKNGVIFSLDPSWSNMDERIPVPGPGWEKYPKRMEVYMTANCERGSVVTDLFGPNVCHNGAPNDRYTIQYTYFDEWVGLVDEFVENIRTRRAPKINLAWHKNTIRAMNAVYESIATGKPVYL